MFKTSLINNRPHNRLSNILWTAYSKLMDRTTYMVYFQQSTTASSNITVFIIIIPHLHHQLINNKLQGSVQDYLKDIFTTTNHSLLQHLTKKSHSWKSNIYSITYQKPTTASSYTLCDYKYNKGKGLEKNIPGMISINHIEVKGLGKKWFTYQHPSPINYCISWYNY